MVRLFGEQMIATTAEVENQSVEISLTSPAAIGDQNLM